MLSVFLQGACQVFVAEHTSLQDARDSRDGTKCAMVRCKLQVSGGFSTLLSRAPASRAPRREIHPDQEDSSESNKQSMINKAGGERLRRLGISAVCVEDVSKARTVCWAGM